MHIISQLGINYQFIIEMKQIISYNKLIEIQKGVNLCIIY